MRAAWVPAQELSRADSLLSTAPQNATWRALRTALAASSAFSHAHTPASRLAAMRSRVSRSRLSFRDGRFHLDLGATQFWTNARVVYAIESAGCGPTRT